jgi:hypothetical protein
MNRSSYPLAVFAIAAGLLLTAADAQAQMYGEPGVRQPVPLYPYAVRSDRPYAVQVAPNAYVIHRPAVSRDYPYVGCKHNCAPRHVHHVARPAHSAETHATAANDPVPVEESRDRRAIKEEIINTRTVVRNAPVVVETRRVVNDPPRVIVRKHYVEDAPARRKQAAVVEDSVIKPARPDLSKGRVIHAEAEVTILGPDRMSIRLFRKGAAGVKAKASAN